MFKLANIYKVIDDNIRLRLLLMETICKTHELMIAKLVGQNRLFNYPQKRLIMFLSMNKKTQLQ